MDLIDPMDVEASDSPEMLPTDDSPDVPEATDQIDNVDSFHYFGELDSNATYESGGCTYETDDQGRVESVSGQLHLGEGERTSHQTEVGHMGLETDEGGHLIGTRFEGSPEGFNLTPQDANLNRGGWKTMENEWATALDAGQEVEALINVMYEQDSMRPMGYHVLDTINGESHERQFVNIPQGQLG